MSTDSELFFIQTDKIDSSVRQHVAAGLQTLLGIQFVVEGGSTAQHDLIDASFKRCAVLWKLLLKELKQLIPARASCSPTLLLKLQYSQDLCLKTWDLSSHEIKLSVARHNMRCVNFVVQLSCAIIEGLATYYC